MADDDAALIAEAREYRAAAIGFDDGSWPVSADFFERVANRLEALAASEERLAEVLEGIEDTLGFYEGSAEILRPAGRLQVVINAQEPDGDFQRMLNKARAALAARPKP